MIEDVKCPECDGPMTSRVNRSTGQRFWGCAAYPKCRGTRNTDGEAPRRHSDPGTVVGEYEEIAPSERARRNDSQRWRNG